MDYNQIMALAEMVAVSGNYPNDLRVTTKVFSDVAQGSVLMLDKQATVNNIAMTMMRGIESGMQPLSALNAIVWVNGKPCIYGDMALAIVRSNAHFRYIEETYDKNTKTAICVIKRDDQKDGEITQRTFSAAEAEAADLLRLDHYQKYLKRMLQIRARIWCIRDSFGDILNGLYIAEEQTDYLQTKELPQKEEIDQFTAQDIKKKSSEKPSLDELKKPETNDKPKYHVEFRSPSVKWCIMSGTEIIERGMDNKKDAEKRLAELLAK